MSFVQTVTVPEALTTTLPAVFQSASAPPKISSIANPNLLTAVSIGLTNSSMLPPSIVPSSATLSYTIVLTSTLEGLTTVEPESTVSYASESSAVTLSAIPILTDSTIHASLESANTAVERTDLAPGTLTTSTVVVEASSTHSGKATATPSTSPSNGGSRAAAAGGAAAVALVAALL